jgi:hypothetical protein
MLVGTWVRRRSRRGRKVTYEKNLIVHTPTPRRLIETRVVVEEGPEVKGGGGGVLPRWLEWWRIRQARADWQAVVREVDGRLESQGVHYDERDIRHGISEVERLMRPVKN